jgi:seryl-tRNA synthetase
MCNTFQRRLLLAAFASTLSKAKKIVGFCGSFNIANPRGAVSLYYELSNEWWAVLIPLG